MLKLTSQIIGLELHLLSQVTEKEKKVYKKIGVTYLVILGLAAIAGTYLFYMIDDHWFSMILGCLIFLFLFGAIFRVILVTNRDSILDSHGYKSKLRRLLPTMSGVLRLIIGGIFALVLAFPLASAVNHNLVMRISEEKIKEVKNEVNGSAKVIAIVDLEEDIKHTHFPLTVFIALVESNRILPWLILTFLVIIYQQMLLGKARNGKGFIYQAMAKQEYVELIREDYRLTLEHGFSFAENKFKVDLSKERDELDNDDMYPPLKVIPFPTQWEYKEDENLVKKVLDV